MFSRCLTQKDRTGKMSNDYYVFFVKIKSKKVNEFIFSVPQNIPLTTK